MGRILVLPFREWRRLRRRAYFSQQNGGHEVSGLFGVRDHIQIVLVFLKSGSPRPAHFEIDWPEFRRGRNEMQAIGARYLGIFHSHPVSEAILGPGDLRWARPNSRHLVYDVCGCEARLWKVVLRKGRKVPLEVPIRIERTGPKASK